MITLDDLKRIIGSGQGNVIVIENLTINDESRHLTVNLEGIEPSEKLLYPWWTFDKASCDRASKAIRDRWEHDHESTGYL